MPPSSVLRTSKGLQVQHLIPWRLPLPVLASQRFYMCLFALYLTLAVIVPVRLHFAVSCKVFRPNVMVMSCTVEEIWDTCPARVQSASSTLMDSSGYGVGLSIFSAFMTWSSNSANENGNYCPYSLLSTCNRWKFGFSSSCTECCWITACFIPFQRAVVALQTPATECTGWKEGIKFWSLVIGASPSSILRCLNIHVAKYAANTVVECMY